MHMRRFAFALLPDWSEAYWRALPNGTFYPMFIIATLAAIIASQVSIPLHPCLTNAYQYLVPIMPLVPTEVASGVVFRAHCRGSSKIPIITIVFVMPTPFQRNTLGLRLRL